MTIQSVYNNSALFLSNLPLISNDVNLPNLTGYGDDTMHVRWAIFRPVNSQIICDHNNDNSSAVAEMGDRLTQQTSAEKRRGVLCPFRGSWAPI